jgi:4'-phosphopantetheinyl transferase
VSILDSLHLEQDEVHVWWAHARPRPTALLAFLDPIEATRLSSLPRAADRDRFASAHVLTKVALAGYQHLSFVDEVAIRSECKHCGSEAHGKPVLISAHPEFTFSLAYAGARAGVAIARCPVGIDVTTMGVERPHEAARTWARKEAVLKATGDGLEVPIAALTVARPDEDAALVAWDGGPEPGDVQLVDLTPGAGHVGALAMLTNTPHGKPPFRVTEHDGEALLTAAIEGPTIA